MTTFIIILTIVLTQLLIFGLVFFFLWKKVNKLFNPFNGLNQLSKKNQKLPDLEDLRKQLMMFNQKKS
jgi:hypothetical protein